MKDEHLTEWQCAQFNRFLAPSGRPVANGASVPVHWLAGARRAQIRGGIHWFHWPSAQNQGTVWPGRTNLRSLQVSGWFLSRSPRHGRALLMELHFNPAPAGCRTYVSTLLIWHCAHSVDDALLLWLQCRRGADRCLYHSEHCLGAYALRRGGGHLPNCQNAADTETCHGADWGKHTLIKQGRDTAVNVSWF